MGKFINTSVVLLGMGTIILLSTAIAVDMTPPAEVPKYLQQFKTHK